MYNSVMCINRLRRRKRQIEVVEHARTKTRTKRKYRKVKKIQNANRKEQTIKDGKQEQKKKS